MSVFELMEKNGHEQLVFCQDEPSGLRAIIGIHSTALGPALGGLRMWPYKCEEDAIVDVLRLSRGMTYKNAAMGLNFGGGKSVIIGDPRKDKSEQLFRAFGRFVDSLGGRYYTAEDVGTGVEEIAIVHQQTRYVLGLREKSGDPSPLTAYGVYRGMKACLRAAFGDESLKGRRVAIQGMGHVGVYLARHLFEEGAQLFVADIFPERVEAGVKEFGARAVPPEAIYDVDCDVFAPCALGAVINDETLPRLKCRIVAGAANNQLSEPRHGDALFERGVIYAPDYVINGGGVMNVAEEFTGGGYSQERSYARVATIYDKVARVLQMSRDESIPTYRAADRMAEERIARIGRLAKIYLPGHH